MTSKEIDMIAERVADIVLRKMDKKIKDSQSKMIKINEAAKLVSMSHQTLRRYIDEIPHVQKGKKCAILFRPQDVLDWAANR